MNLPVLTLFRNLINRAGCDCWGETAVWRDESWGEQEKVRRYVNRVINNPAKIADAPAIWLPEIGSPSQNAATIIATIGVR